MSDNILLSLSAIISLLPPIVLAMRRNHRPDTIFWLVIFVATIGPVNWVLLSMTDFWHANLQMALWVTISATMVIFFIITLVTDLVEYFDPHGDFQIDFVLGLVARLISPILAFTAILVLYSWMANMKVRMQYVIPGAFLATIAFIAGQWCFIWVVSTFSLYNAVYGSVGALLALQAWLYISAIILLFGAQLTSMFHKSVAKEDEKSRLDKTFLFLKRKGYSIGRSIKP